MRDCCGSTAITMATPRANVKAVLGSSVDDEQLTVSKMLGEGRTVNQRCLLSGLTRTRHFLVGVARAWPHPKKTPARYRAGVPQMTS